MTVPAGAEAGDMIQVPLTVTDQPNWAPTGAVKYTQARPSASGQLVLFNVTDHLGICCLSCFCCTALILFGQMREKQHEDKENFPQDGARSAGASGATTSARRARVRVSPSSGYSWCTCSSIVSLVFQDRGICQHALTPGIRVAFTSLVDRLAHIFLVLLRLRALPAHGDPPEVRDHVRRVITQPFGAQVHGGVDASLCGNQ